MVITKGAHSLQYGPKVLHVRKLPVLKSLLPTAVQHIHLAMNLSVGPDDVGTEAGPRLSGAEPRYHTSLKFAAAPPM